MSHERAANEQSRSAKLARVDPALEAAGITVNRNRIPFDETGPQVGSGIRIGTPAVTTRGMKEGEMDEIADLIDRVSSHIDDESELRSVRKKVEKLCARFPFPSNP